MAEVPSRGTVHVPTSLNLKTRFFSATAGLWKKLAAVESAVLRDDLESISISAPIYVTGVPRAGTTITTELLERHPEVTSHRYSDFPNVYTPYWQNWLAERSRRSSAPLVERAHGDRIMVSQDSPEAVEEVIWMQFFNHLHDPRVNQVLDRDTSNPQFESFYRDHLRKLLLARRASRYLAKGNYNITRLAYIQKLVPDARFVVVVRNPVNHVASLVKQDRRFQQASLEDKRVPGQLGHSGHFEFGPDQRSINTGRREDAERIHRAWSEGELPVAWARYWSLAYEFLLDQIERDAALKKSVLIVRYESLCREPDVVIREILAHCRLEVDVFESVIAEYSKQISEPDYYKPDFSQEELDWIKTITEAVAKRLGY